MNLVLLVLFTATNLIQILQAKPQEPWINVRVELPTPNL
jgi:hypothetical protein